MFDAIRGRLGYVSVIEDNTEIVINGVNARLLSSDIGNTWNTSRVFKFIFHKSTSYRLHFRKFFALEVLYILESLLVSDTRRTPRRVLTKIISELKINTWIRTTIVPGAVSPFDFSKLKDFTKQPLPHQRRFLDTYAENTHRYGLNGYILAADPGAGKTLMALYTARCLHSDVTICIVPNNSVNEVWNATIDNDIINDNSRWSTDSKEPLTGDKRYYVFHYEALDKALALAKSLRKGTKVTIVLDECHNFNEIKSLRTQRFIELCKMLKPISVLWTSGTPIKQMGSEVIPCLYTIDPLFNDYVSIAFGKLYGASATRANDIIRHRMGLVTFKVDKTTILDNEVIETRIDIKIPNGKDYTLTVIRDKMAKFIKERLTMYLENMDEYEAFYNQCIEDVTPKMSSSQLKDLATYKQYVKTIRKGYDPFNMRTESTFCNKFEDTVIIANLDAKRKHEFRSVKSIIKYVQLKIVGEALGGILGKAREDCHRDMLDHIDFSTIIDNSEKKTLVFTSYVSVVKDCNVVLEEQGYKPTLVYAETNKNLSSIVDTFRKDENVNPLIATFKSLSTAVPLIMANSIILLNAPFREYEKKQVVARIDRLGQDSPVRIFEVFLDTGDEPNISTRSKDILEWSKQQVEEIMGIHLGPSVDIALESLSKPYMGNV